MVSLVRVTQNVEEVSLQNDPTLMMADPDPDPAGWLDTAVLPVVVVDGVEAEFLEKSTLNEPVWLCTIYFFMHINLIHMMMVIIRWQEKVGKDTEGESEDGVKNNVAGAKLEAGLENLINIPANDEAGLSGFAGPVEEEA
jgi:hypothetical protein